MRTGRPKAELKLSLQEQAQLSSLAASRSLPHALVARAKLVLWAAAGASNSTIAQRLSWSLPTVGKWRQRFVERRVAGLHDELRPGRPRSYGDEGRRLDQPGAPQASPRPLRNGAYARWPSKPVSPKARWRVTSHCLVSSRIAARTSSSPPIPSSSRRCATWSGSISIRRRRRWCCADEKRLCPGTGANPARVADRAGLP